MNNRKENKRKPAKHARAKTPQPGTKPPKRPRVKLPEPVRTVNTGWHPRTPEITQIPLDCPAGYPRDLWLQTRTILTEALQKFSEQRQMLDLCKHTFSQTKMGPIILPPVLAGKMKPHEAHSAMVGLLRSVLSRNNAHGQESEVTISDAWTALERAIAEAEEQRAHTTPSAGTAEGKFADRLAVEKHNTGVDSKEPGEAPETGHKNDQKGNPSLIDGKDSVAFRTAEQYLGISERQRQNLVARGVLVVEGQGHNRQITTESLRKYLPSKNPK